MWNRKRILLSSIVSVFLVGILFQIINPIWWQNVKLKSSAVWGFATLSNNPLLPSLDTDISVATREGVPETRINIELLLSGGPPKDGIPSIDTPQFEKIQDTSFSDEELIIGVTINGEAKAYPYAILNWHEIVNDEVGGEPLAITYCPLCETNSVFKRTLQGEVVSFGVSGKLYNSCLVMYDRSSDTLYAQPWGIGVVGPHTNLILERVPAIRTTIGKWKKMYPSSLILTTDTGYRRNYDGYPYGTYYTDDTIVFPIKNENLITEHPKEIAQVIFRHDTNPFDEFSGDAVYFNQKDVRDRKTISFEWGETKGQAEWDEDLETIVFKDVNGGIIPDMALFHFVYPPFFK